MFKKKTTSLFNNKLINSSYHSLSESDSAEINLCSKTNNDNLPNRSSYIYKTEHYSLQIP